MAETFRGRLPELVAFLLVAVPGLISIAVYFSIGIVTWVYSVIWGIATLSSIALVAATRKSGQDWHQTLRTLFIASFIFSAISIATGIGNNATDEPFAMPAYLSAVLSGQDPYYTPVSVSYVAHLLNIWTNPVSGEYYYSYLPLLLFFQIPGTGATGYRAVCLACWVGIVYMVRRDEYAALCLVSPVVALCAANGFTDLPVLLLMTFSLRGAPGTTSSKVVEYASYAMKQFANAFWFVYYIARRDALRATLVIVLTLVFVSPFIIWHPTGIWCEALTFSWGPGCAGAPNDERHLSDLYSHWNYYLWILWVVALYWVTLRLWAGKVWTRLRRTEPAAPAPPAAGFAGPTSKPDDGALPDAPGRIPGGDGAEALARSVPSEPPRTPVDYEPGTP